MKYILTLLLILLLSTSYGQRVFQSSQRDMIWKDTLVRAAVPSSIYIKGEFLLIEEPSMIFEMYLDSVLEVFKKNGYSIITCRYKDVANEFVTVQFFNNKKALYQVLVDVGEIKVIYTQLKEIK